MKVKAKVKVIQLCPTLFVPMDFTVHGILQARILGWVAYPFSRGSSQPRNQTVVSCIEGRFFNSWATREARTEPWSIAKCLIQKSQGQKNHDRNGIWNSLVILMTDVLCINTSLQYLCSFVICSLFSTTSIRDRMKERTNQMTTVREQRGRPLLVTTQGPVQDICLTPSGSAFSYLPGRNLCSDFNFQLLSFQLLLP